jgi:RNA-binding protein Nova
MDPSNNKASSNNSLSQSLRHESAHGAVVHSKHPPLPLNAPQPVVPGESTPHHPPDEGGPHYSFPGDAVTANQVLTAAPPAIQEGSATRNVKSRQSPSPPHSTAPATDITATPTSIGTNSNYSGADNIHHVPEVNTAPSFPRDPVPNITDPANPALTPSRTEEVGYAALHTQASNANSSNESDHGQRYNPANYPFALKILVSNNVAGSIIGRAGQTIDELQTQSQTRIKLSQAGDYYPGTQDRVCLIQGKPENVRTALQLLLARLFKLQSDQHAQQLAWQLQRPKGETPSFDFVVRLLIPTASGGMIIGKMGSNIKYLEETSGVSSVRLSSKESNTDGNFPSAAILSATAERVVKVTGSSLECCLQCVFLIAENLLIHPDVSRYSNMTTSYSRILSEGAAMTVPYGSSVAVPQVSNMPRNRPILDSLTGTPRHLSLDQHQLHHRPPTALWEGTQPGPQSSFIPRAGTLKQRRPQDVHANQRRIVSSPDLPGMGLNQHSLNEPHTPDRFSGYSPSLSRPSYSFVDHPAGLNADQAPLFPVPQSSSLESSSITADQYVGYNLSEPDLLAMHMNQSMQVGGAQPSPSSVSPFSNTLVPQTSTTTTHGNFQAQMFVPDTMVGSILGREGRTRNELERRSGTSIRISQRGEFVPGTRLRIVTIVGPSAQCVWQAQYRMNQRMVLPPTASYPPQQQKQSSPPLEGPRIPQAQVSIEHGYGPSEHVVPFATDASRNALATDSSQCSNSPSPPSSS